MAEPKPIELLYKSADGIDLYMDVYLPESATEENPAPILLWWHGGGLLQGIRKSVAPHHLDAPSKHNVCFISADYRLAPQFRFPAILSDCSAAMSFIHTPAFKEAVSGRADTSRVILSGSSAGGWLSLLCGTGIGYDESGLPRPPPVQGIAAIYPITDLQDEFWTKKQHPVPYMGKMIPHEDVQPFINPDDEGSKVSGCTIDDKRIIFYHYMLQEAILADLLLSGTNIPPTAFSIASSLKTLLASPSKYPVPPTFIVHGDIDDKVTVRQARDVAAALEELKQSGMNVEYEYEEVRGLNHGYDREPGVEMERMYNFIHKVFSK